MCTVCRYVTHHECETGAERNCPTTFSVYPLPSASPEVRPPLTLTQHRFASPCLTPRYPLFSRAQEVRRMGHAWIEGNHSSSPCIFCTKEVLAYAHTAFTASRSRSRRGNSFSRARARCDCTHGRCRGGTWWAVGAIGAWAWPTTSAATRTWAWSATLANCGASSCRPTPSTARAGKSPSPLGRLVSFLFFYYYY
jgi:hypothetical protein